MGELGAFLKLSRVTPPQRAPRERVGDFREFVLRRPDDELAEQGARCMECGVPFCHNGCPLGNLIPDWNDLVFRDRWADAIAQLHATNNFPEFTGRLCPAPCEAACVLEIREGDAVTIKQIEHAIIDRAWDEGWVVPQPPESETGRSVAVIGAGPAGLAAAQQLRRIGHRVVVFERDESAGGLVRFGVPDFKIEKHLVERRVDQLRAEGVGRALRRRRRRRRALRGHPRRVRRRGHRHGLAGCRATCRRPGRELDGIHPAMDYLYVRNRAIATDDGAPGAITAQGKHVVVIGGGDTGADCVGNSIREGALSVAQLEIMERPADHRPDAKTPWPLWPQKFRLSYAMEEATVLGRGEQSYAVATTAFSGSDGRVQRIEVAHAEAFQPVAGTEKELPADLVLLAMGFLHPEPLLLDQAEVAQGQARQRQGAGLRDVAVGRLRRGRRAPRAVADRLGDQRGPSVRANGRPLARRAVRHRARADPRGQRPPGRRGSRRPAAARLGRADRSGLSAGYTGYTGYTSRRGQGDGVDARRSPARG